MFSPFSFFLGSNDKWGLIQDCEKKHLEMVVFVFNTSLGSGWYTECYMLSVSLPSCVRGVSQNNSCFLYSGINCKSIIIIMLYYYWMNKRNKQCKHLSHSSLFSFSAIFVLSCLFNYFPGLQEGLDSSGELQLHTDRDVRCSEKQPSFRNNGWTGTSCVHSVGGWPPVCHISGFPDGQQDHVLCATAGSASGKQMNNNLVM